MSAPRILAEAPIDFLPDRHVGKVRESYDLPDGRRLLIATDRISAFDRILACVPHKGAVLTGLARHGFEATADILPNHVLAHPDPNALEALRLDILPVEVVVRGHLAGATDTSILTRYRRGERRMYGLTLPDGLRDNQELPEPVLTPTTKAAAGGHDAPLSPAEIVSSGLLPAALWEETAAAALALFARGRALAAERGLILADTKYEFGLDAEGRLRVADEIHTPDSSRYWLAEGYGAAFEAGTRPPSLDKDFVRAWVAARCDPYRDPIPEIPAEVIEEASQVYLAAFARLTGADFVPDLSGDSVLERVRANLARYAVA